MKSVCCLRLSLFFNVCKKKAIEDGTGTGCLNRCENEVVFTKKFSEISVIIYEHRSTVFILYTSTDDFYLRLHKTDIKYEIHQVHPV